MVSKTVLIVAGLLLSGAGLAIAHGYANDVGPLGAAIDKARPLLGKPHAECAPRDGEEAGGEGPKHHPRCRPKAPPFSYDAESGAVEGRHVSFVATEDGLLDYTSEGPWADARIFDRVTVAGLSAAGATRGPTYRAGDGEAGVGLVAFNAPNAALMIRAREGATVTYDVADDVAIEVLDNGDVRLTRGDASARIHARNGTLSVEGDVVTATLAERGAAGFAIEGYPRLLAMEKAALGRHR